MCDIAMHQYFTRHIIEYVLKVRLEEDQEFILSVRLHMVKRFSFNKYK